VAAEEGQRKREGECKTALVLDAVSDGASTRDEIQTSVHMTSRSRDGDALLQASCPSA
jgi:hypothetical protein